ncbi:hypothetical protein LX87_04211 [Larkinella arboricola]|uniref:Xaa-Pro dipeptidyl-peptidase-like domain-containing protein n=1 Tax=Larkinella arboricola TaxID=643671 RepID=A0A327WXR6_LARAB|nr:hypothetical protein LX87_04211 [Larkinella arboricola]
MKNRLFALCLAFLTFAVRAQQPNPDAEFIRQNYQKTEYQISMRDGTKLHTAVYVPKDASASTTYPILMQRTCYSVAPYGPDQYPNRLRPSATLMRGKYIFVYQDVRGRYMSEGVWTNMTPNLPDPARAASTQAASAKKKARPATVSTAGSPDESSDTYDTIDWLLKNVKFNNGRVGQWGISYPGFYTVAGAVDAHPALKASSPQAPVSDFFFDDFHHNGAFIQAYIFAYPVFGIQHPKPTAESWFMPAMFNAGIKDGYQWQYDLGPLKNADRYYKDNFFWQETVNHPNYDEFWQKRNILPTSKMSNMP